MAKKYSDNELQNMSVDEHKQQPKQSNTLVGKTIEHTLMVYSAIWRLLIGQEIVAKSQDSRR